MNRIDRLTAILIHLQSKRVVKAQEMADRFGVSLRSIYRDIRALEEAGVPIGAEAGIGYWLAEGYHLPPVMFSPEEAQALVLGAKLIEQLADDGVSDAFSSALYKIKSVLQSNEKEKLEDLGMQIRVSRRAAPGDIPPNFLAKIQQALVDRKMLAVRYFSASKQEHTERQLEPIGISYYNNSWHLIAFCHRATDYRDFRVDRIQDLHLLRQTYKPSLRLSLQKYIDSEVNRLDMQQAVIRLDKRIARYAENQKYLQGWVSEQALENEMEMTFWVISLSSLGRWLLSYGSFVQVLSPPSLQTFMQEQAERLYRHYRAAQQPATNPPRTTDLPPKSPPGIDISVG